MANGNLPPRQANELLNELIAAARAADKGPAEVAQSISERIGKRQRLAIQSVFHSMTGLFPSEEDIRHILP